MHEDFEYVKSLENEVDELESEKADFSNMYDLLLEECVSKDVICSYLLYLCPEFKCHIITELQCMYLHKVKECDCLAQKLSKQTESVNKKEKQQFCKENASNVFRKEREQYHEIQDLKAQMQDKNIAISELKKLIENCKGKSVETQFNKPSVVRQPNAQQSKPLFFRKTEPAPFLNVQMTPRSSKFKRRLIAADQASVFMATMSVHISSGLVLNQMASDHNCSELGIQDHNNEPSSSKLVPKVVP
ncbi:hypothetical protein Tco_0434538 [Tanacetum coccineum]